jgi:SAM-dependent methyltransferase
MEDQWDDPSFASHWDQIALIGTPTRAEQLDILLALIADVYKEGTAILDLGIGSGLVEERLFARVPAAYVVGIESSQAMLDLAKPRLAPFEQRYSIIQRDFTDLKAINLPSETYSIVISVQAFHHLPHPVQQDLFQTIFDLLPPNGIFLFLDRILLEPEHFADLYRTVWNRLVLVNGAKSSLSGDGFLQQLQDKGDYPATLEEHLAWLRAAGFAATCLHMHLNRVLLAGVKEA